MTPFFRLCACALPLIALSHSVLRAAVIDAYLDPHDRMYVRILSADSSLPISENPEANAASATDADLRDLASHWFFEPVVGPVDTFWIRNRVTDFALRLTGPVGTARSESLDPSNAQFHWRPAVLNDAICFENVAYPGTFLAVSSDPGGTLTSSAAPNATPATRWHLRAIPRGATLPWLSYDESNFDTLTPPAEVITTTYGSTFERFSFAAEAQNHGCIILNGYGTRVAWTVREPANALTIRYSIQDGMEGTLTLSLTDASGSTRSIKVPVRSAQAWVYFDGGEEHDTNADGRLPAKRYAEARVRLDAPVAAGDVLALSREPGDEMVWIDVVELESTAPVIPSNPDDFYNPTHAPWNAAGDGITDDYFAVLNCLTDAANDGKKVYLPEGRFRIGFELILPEGTHLQGAGMWYTELLFSNSGYQGAGGIRADGSNQVLRDLFISGSQTTRVGGYKGIKGNWGTHSLIENVWVENTETGMWIADFYGTLSITDGLVVRNSRFRNTFADGINLSSGSRNCIVENCHFRGTGDDALATWAAGRQQNLGPTFNQKFRYNTIECGYRAGGIGVFGGGAHEIHHNVVRDQFIGAGIRLNTVFIWLDFNGPQGYPFNASGDPIRIYDNTLVRTGALSLFGEEIAAIDLVSRDTDVERIAFEHIDVIGSTYSAIRLHGNGTLANPLPVFKDVTFASIRVHTLPIAARATGIALGSASISDILLVDVPTLAAPQQGFDIFFNSSLTTWLTARFGNPDSPSAQPTADPDINGITNLMEFALGSDPSATPADLISRLPAPSLAATDSTPLQIHFRTRPGIRILADQSAFATGPIRITPQTSLSLSPAAWTTAQFTEVGTRITFPDGSQSLTLELKSRANHAHFARLQVNF